MCSPVSLHWGTGLVVGATWSIALASRLVAGSNSVISPVCSGTATAGHLLRVAVMPTPADTSISLLRPQPETVARTAVPHSRTSDLRVEGRLRVKMLWLSITGRRGQGGPLTTGPYISVYCTRTTR